MQLGIHMAVSVACVLSGLVLSSCANKPATGGRCAPLWPVPGPFVGAPAIGHETEDALGEVLFAGETKPREVEMVAVSSYAVEEAVYIINARYGELVTPEYVVAVRPQYHVGVNSQPSGEGRQRVPTTVARAWIDTPAFEEIRALWQEMVQGARFPKEIEVSHQTDYYFTVQLSVGPGTAYVEGPPPESCALSLVDVGRMLMAYARAEEKDRGSIRMRLLEQVKVLRKRWGSHAARE